MDEDISDLTRRADQDMSTVRKRPFIEQGGRARNRVGTSKEERLCEVEGVEAEAPFVHPRGGVKTKSKESMGAKVRREARESALEGGEGVAGAAGGGGGGGGVGDGNAAPAPRVRAPGSCGTCKNLGLSGEGHVARSPKCPNYLSRASSSKRKATLGAEDGQGTG